MRNIFLLSLCVIAASIANGDYETPEAAKDRAQDLPGAQPLKNPTYSGYLDTSGGGALHYWFIESQNSPATDPLIFWFNGGPGCSSMAGALTEIGPYLIEEPDGLPYPNPHTWSQFSNIVFVESPFGVGFSTSNTEALIHQSDHSTTRANYEAILDFYRRFPQSHANAMFIAGESYAGVYLPMLGAKIVEGAARLNFKGVLIGNGVLNEMLAAKTVLEFGYGHGLVDERSWDGLLRCCDYNWKNCSLVESVQVEECAMLFQTVYRNMMATKRLNPYDIYGKCEGRDGSRVIPGVLAKSFGFAMDWMVEEGAKRDNSSKPRLGIDKTPCIEADGLTEYLNDAAVRKALNIPDSAAKWELCNDEVTHSYRKEEKDVKPFVQRLIAQRIPILLFYGNTDLLCPFLMGQRFVEELGLKVTTAQEPWFFEREFAGVRQILGGGLVTYATVNGAGHMAAAWKPAQTRQLVMEFIGNATVFGTGPQLLLPN